MALHIKDEAATKAVRRLAEERRITLTEAVRAACEEALERDAKARPVGVRLADLHARLKKRDRRGKSRQGVFRRGVGRVTTKTVLVETSAIVAITLEEPGWEALAEEIVATQAITTTVAVFEACLAVTRERRVRPTEAHEIVGRFWNGLG